jgi:hypothetical protein
MSTQNKLAFETYNLGTSWENFLLAKYAQGAVTIKYFVPNF